MINVWMKLVKGDLLWKYLRLRYAINDTTVVLFLAGENPKIDEYALKYIVGHAIQDVTERVYTKREISWLIEEMQKIK